MCVHATGDQKSKSVAVSLGHFPHCWRQGVSLSQRIINSARLEDKPMPEVLLTLPPQRWDHRHELWRLTFSHDVGDQTKVLLLT